MKICLDCGANINFTDSTGNSALSYALTLRGRVDIIRVSGQPVNLFWCGFPHFLASGFLPQLLLEYGASASIKVPGFPSMLHMAVESGEIDIARLLFQAHPLRPSDLKIPAGNTAMQALISNPPPFKIRTLKTMCWVVVGKHLDLEKAAKRQKIPHFE